ncbi:MAG: hypothetical protein ACO1OK_00805 [Devosia sp.]
MSLPFILALLSCGGALAQPVPEGPRAQAWCGVALSMMAEEVADTANAEQKQLAEIFRDGGTALIEAATVAYGDSGWSPERTDELLASLRIEVEASLAGDARPALSFEDCAALAGFPQ